MAERGAPIWLSPLWLLLQVTEISNVKCVTRLPKETKRQAVAIIFTDDSARTFTCDSGEDQGLQTSAGPAVALWTSRRRQGRAGSGWYEGWGPCLPGWDNSGRVDGVGSGGPRACSMTRPHFSRAGGGGVVQDPVGGVSGVAAQ